jgi:pyridoxine kinase
MARALILSSHVATSSVGGSAQALALAALGIEPVVVPTVLFGRHPG